MNRERKSFTLIELLVVLALVAILSVVVILTLNPAELLKQARDSTRLSDLATVNTALNLFSTDVINGFTGTSTVVYVSIPDNASSTCGSLGLPTLPTGYTYNCVTQQNLRNTDGTGWIPVNFQRISSNTPISQLPIDPTNTTSTRLYYTYTPGGSWELNATVEASKNKLGGQNDLVSKDGGTSPSVYELGNNLSLNPIEQGDSSLVGYWNFEEGVTAGTSVSTDRSGHGTNLTWSGAQAGSSGYYSAGRVGSWAGYFNGTDNNVSAVNPNILNFGSSGFSISLWVKKGVLTGQKQLIGKVSDTVHPGWGLYQHSGGSLTWLIADGSGTYDAIYASAINDNTWHHIVVMVNRESGESYLYADGILAQSGNITIVGSVSSTYDFNMASTWGNMDGLLDDVRVYNRALSAAEILALYNAAK